MDRYIAKRFHNNHTPISWIIGWGLLIIIGIAALFGYPYLTQKLVADPDAYGRVLLAWLPLENNNFWAIRFDDDWPPFHSLLLRVGFMIWPSFYFTPQILTFFMGLGSIPLFYLYSRGSLTVSQALIATMLFALIPIRVIINSQPLTEGMILPFILLTAIAITRKHPLWITAGIIGFSIAAGIRYEAWYMLPFLLYYVSTRVHPPVLKIIALISACITPVFWIMATRLHTGIWFSFLSGRAGIAGESMKPFIYNIHTSLHLVTTNLLLILPLPIFIFALVGSATDKSKTEKGWHQIIMTILPWYYLFILWLQVVMGTMEWVVSRFYFLIVIFFIPLIVRGAAYIFRTKKILFWLLIAGILIRLPQYITYQQHALTYKALLGTTPFKKYTAAWEIIHFANNHDPRAFTYIEPPENNYDFVTMISYFTKTSMFNSVHTEDSPPVTTPYIIVEKEETKPSPWQFPIAIDNEYFTVHTTTERNK